MSGLTRAGKPRRRVSPGAPASERILLHTDRSGDHWIWTAALHRDGYGVVQFDGRLRKAHRLSYETFVGPIPDGLHIDHLCRVRACVNPEHLEPVTCLVNVRRSPISHGSETHCQRGHEYDEKNTKRWNGRRYCGPCQRAYSQVYRWMTLDERAERKAAGLPLVDLDAFFADAEQERAA